MTPESPDTTPAPPEGSPATPPPSSTPVSGPVSRYFAYSPRAIKVLLGALVLLLAAQGLSIPLGWPEKAQASLFAVQMLLVGVLLAPGLPIWQRRSGVALDPTPEPPPDTPTFRDGF